RVPGPPPPCQGPTGAGPGRLARGSRRPAGRPLGPGRGRGGPGPAARGRDGPGPPRAGKRPHPSRAPGGRGRGAREGTDAVLAGATGRVDRGEDAAGEPGPGGRQRPAGGPGRPRDGEATSLRVNFFSNGNGLSPPASAQGGRLNLN